MAKKTIRNVQELIAENLIPPTDPGVMEVANRYAIAISPHVLKLSKNSEGIAKQFIPTSAELNVDPRELFDPIGDKANSPLKGLIHRYPDRVLLQPVTVCPVYCRFCFRREIVGKGTPALTAKELQDCYAYIANKPEIWEVILSGGDPLILKPKQITNIITNLDQIPNVEIIRIHTRVPMVDPKRINVEMLAALTKRKPIYMALHINHPDEFSAEAIAAVNLLADNGIVLLGQSVLLKDINDNITVLGKLMRTMVKHRIKPYYLHHADLAKGSAHFRTTIAKGQELIAQLRGAYSGLCQPEYVLDIPGGFGKSPIGPTYLCKHGSAYQVKDFNGCEHSYTD